jgi:hypothetical protein
MTVSLFFGGSEFFQGYFNGVAEIPKFAFSYLFLYPLIQIEPDCHVFLLSGFCQSWQPFNLTKMRV